MADKHWIEVRGDEMEKKSVDEMDYMNSVSKRLSEAYVVWTGEE